MKSWATRISSKAIGKVEFFLENFVYLLYQSFFAIIYSHVVISFLLFDYQQIRHSQSSLVLVLHQLTCAILLTDYSRDFKSFLKYSGNVILAGMTNSYDEETLIERLWEIYEKEEVLITQQLFCLSPWQLQILLHNNWNSWLRYCYLNIFCAMMNVWGY